MRISRCHFGQTIKSQTETENSQSIRVEKLAKALEGAYINHGLSTDLATQ